jgi:hypothetical protein
VRLFKTASADALPSANAVGVQSLQAQFTAVNQVQYFYASQPGSTNTPTVGQCLDASSNTVATVVPVNPSAGGLIFSVTAVAQGACVVTISGDGGQIGTLSVGVTITQGSVS